MLGWGLLICSPPVLVDIWRGAGPVPLASAASFPPGGGFQPLLLRGMNSLVLEAVGRMASESPEVNPNSATCSGWPWMSECHHPADLCFLLANPGLGPRLHVNHRYPDPVCLLLFPFQVCRPSCLYTAKAPKLTLGLALTSWEGREGGREEGRSGEDPYPPLDPTEGSRKTELNRGPTAGTPSSQVFTRMLGALGPADRGCVHTHSLHQLCATGLRIEASCWGSRPHSSKRQVHLRSDGGAPGSLTSRECS